MIQVLVAIEVETLFVIVLASEVNRNSLKKHRVGVLYMHRKESKMIRTWTGGSWLSLLPRRKTAGTPG